ncbi:MAG: hypothetical protein ACYDEF_12615 [Methanosarcina sp.]|nr:hypothetical protein BGV40_05975 [Methanosarcina sp. Ant1]
MDAIPITKAIASGILSKTDIIKNWNLQGLKTRHSGLKALFMAFLEMSMAVDLRNREFESRR